MLNQFSTNNACIARLARTLLFTSLKFPGFSVSSLGLPVPASASVCCAEITLCDAKAHVSVEACTAFS